MLDSVDPFSEGDVIEFKTDGISIRLFKNGIESAITGTNGSYWFNDVNNIDTMYISRLTRLTDAFYTTTFKQIIVIGTPLTDAESLQVSKDLKILNS